MKRILKTAATILIVSLMVSILYPTFVSATSDNKYEKLSNSYRDSILLAPNKTSQKIFR